jgi:hypothetical protein
MNSVLARHRRNPVLGVLLDGGLDAWKVDCSIPHSLAALDDFRNPLIEAALNTCICGQP